MGYKKYKRIDFGDWRFNGDVGKKMDGFEGVHGRNSEGRILFEF